MPNYDKTMTVDLLKWAREDRELASLPLCGNESARRAAMAEEKEYVIQKRLAGLVIEPLNQALRDYGRCPSGVPDSDRIYGSYLARHPEMLEDAYGNPVDGSSLAFCCFPDCGCDGARNCMAKCGANTCSQVFNAQAIVHSVVASFGLDEHGREEIFLEKRP
jgi:hypothetical protein